MSALAAATRRSAAAMSGRRWSSSEGTPVGMAGGSPASGCSGMWKAVAGSPTRTAMACSYCARWTPRSMSCARASSSCAWACGDIALGAEAALEADLREIERLGVRVDGGAQQLGLQVEAAQLEVGDGEQTLQAEARAGEVGGGGLRAGRGGLDLAADCPPEVRLPGDVQRNQELPEVALRCRAYLRSVGGDALRVAEPPRETVG